MNLVITLVQEVPEGVTKEQAQEWAEFELSPGGSVDASNPLICNKYVELDRDDIVEWYIE